jgi:hypothetical protein
MFVDLHDQYRPPPGPEPGGRLPLTPRQTRVLGWIIAANIVGLIVAPIGGATLLQPVIAWMQGQSDRPSLPSASPR